MKKSILGVVGVVILGVVGCGGWELGRGKAGGEVGRWVMSADGRIKMDTVSGETWLLGVRGWVVVPAGWRAGREVVAFDPSKPFELVADR